MEISVPVIGSAAGDPRPESDAEDAAALLAAAIPEAAAGVELRAGEIVFWVPVERGESARRAAQRAVAELAAAGQPLDPARVALRPAAPEAEWCDAWKRYFRTVRLTRQIVVVPSWDRHEAGRDDRVVHLDPGQAFGTGAHESTRLVLRIVQDLHDLGARPARVLDVGTGSGILALAASALWPHAEVLALDSDPVAVAAAQSNVAANRAAGRVQVSSAALTELDGAAAPRLPRRAAEEVRHGPGPPHRFDLALANIQADVLVELSSPLAARIAPGGWLVLSGLLAEQAVSVADRYGERGLVLEELRRGEEDPAWSALVLRCSAS